MPRILCLWLPNWPIQRLLGARPELRSRPLVLAAEGPRGGRVAACSAAAAAQGVRPDMPLAEAKSLVPGLAIERYDPQLDCQALRKLAEACEQFSPCVALEEGVAPESLLLDISNLAHLMGSDAELAARVEAFFTARGWRVRIAVAETVGLAWAVAHANDKARMTNDEKAHPPFVIRHSSFRRFPSRRSALPTTRPRCCGNWASRPSASFWRCRARGWRRGLAINCCCG